MTSDTVNEFNSLNPANFTFAGYYDALPFNAWFWAGWYDNTLASEIGLYVEDSGYVVFGNGYVYPSKRTYNDIRSFVDAQLRESNRDFSLDLRNRIDKEADSLLAWIVQHADDDASGTILEIAKRFRRVTFYWAVGYFAGVVFEDTLRAMAQRAGLNTETLSEYLERPLTHVVRRQKDLVRLKESLKKHSVSELNELESIVESVDKDPGLKREFTHHLAEYDWFGMTGFMGDPLSLAQLIEEVIAVPSKEAAQVTMGGLGRYAEIAANLQYVNQMGAELYQIVGRKSLPIVNKAAAQVGVSRDDLLWLTPEEIFQGNEVTPDATEKIKRRKKGEVAFFFGSDHKVHIVDDVAVVRVVRSIFQPKLEINLLKEIRGQCGSKGAARGSARIIFGKGEFVKMCSGDVLITSMTTPDFVPLMQKACAIVTDIGGLLCHAVIMSRELGKPCVIGTKIATQVFKDGDMVEVDADKGVVRRI